MEELNITSSCIWSTHEETYSDGRTIGILTNFDLDENMKRIDSFAYLFRETDDGGLYIFFETIVDILLNCDLNNSSDTRRVLTAPLSIIPSTSSIPYSAFPLFFEISPNRLSISRASLI